MSSILLPRPLVEEMRGARDLTDPKVYAMVCGLIMELDDLCLINDQVCVSSPTDDDMIDLDLEWPTYGLFFDIEKGGAPDRLDANGIIFKVHHPRTSTLVRVFSYEAAKTVLISVLEQVVDKDDPHDPYKKNLRNPENSIECVRGMPF